MKICGIICEFNPLHNGHQYLINEARKENDFVVCLMSGNFSQRGLPCVMDKYTRAKTAIKAGASIVLELPFVYAVNSADQFAEGAIKILKGLKVNSIIFGSESADKTALEKIANFKLNETKEFKSRLSAYMKKGINYNEAYTSAMSDVTSDKTLTKLALSPNDILASAYIKEIKKQKANISYKVIKRTDNGYNETNPSNEFLSASSIIKLKQENKPYSAFVPPYTLNAIETAPNFDFSKYSAILQNTINTKSIKELSKTFGICEGLEYALKKQNESATSYDELVNSLISKRYRKARIHKLLLYTALNLTNKEYKLIKKSIPAVNVLAVDKNNKSILSQLQSSKAKLIITRKDYEELKNREKLSIDIDTRANTLYSICTSKNISKPKNIFI